MKLKEIEQLKQAKQSEIYQRMQKLETVAGGVKINEEKFQEILKSDYNAELFNQKMKEIFSEEGYFQQEEENVQELKEYLKRANREQQQQEEEDKKQVKNQQQDNNNNNNNKDKDNADQVKTAIPVGIKKRLKAEEIEQLKQNEFQIWYYCDNCQKGLQEYEMKFDCLECEDYTLCKKCKELSMHNHKMRKNFVPKGCVPPADEQIKEILEGVIKCAKCFDKINYTEDYYQKQENECICAKCYSRMKFTEREGIVKVKGKIDKDQIGDSNINKLPELLNDQRINELVDEYYALDFEDIIADGLQTKYKYIKVKPENYGLSDEAIQYCDEKLLNSFVSVKKLAPYRQDEGLVYEKLLKRKRPYVEKNAKQNEKKLRKNLKQLEKIKQQLKELKKQQKKSKKSKIINEIMELEAKEKQLESIIAHGKETMEQINLENAKKLEDNPEYEQIKQQQLLQKNVSQTRLKSYGIDQQ